MIHFVVPEEEEDPIREYLGLWGSSLVPRFRIVPYERLAGERSIPRGTWVFSALDRLGPGMRRFASELGGRMAQLEGFQTLNPPDRTLHRFELLRELHRRGENEFRAVRAEGDISSLRYPVFVRRDRAHDGALSPLLASPSEVRAALGRALVQGHPYADLLVVEFCDTADALGIYRKYAAFAVGDRIIARSLNRGRDWMMKHGGTEYSREMVLEEREYVTGNPHRSELARIFRLANVGYGRIDYSLKGGKLQTWEINLNPNIGRGPSPSRGRVPSELQGIRTETKERFYEAFDEAWRQVDGIPDGPETPIALEEATIRGARHPPVRTSRVRALAALRAAVRPARPVLERFAPPFLRVLEAAARARRKGGA